MAVRRLTFIPEWIFECLLCAGNHERDRRYKRRKKKKKKDSPTLVKLMVSQWNNESRITQISVR